MINRDFFNYSIQANFISEDQFLNQHLKTQFREFTPVELLCTGTPLPEEKTEIYILPAENMGKTDVPHRPFILYGPKSLLREGFLSGCEDYITTPVTSEELYFRIMKTIPLDYRQFTWEEIDFNPYRGVSEEGIQHFSRQEYTILMHLRSRSPEIISRTTLEYLLWGKPRGNSRAVDVHISSLRRKLKSLNPSLSGPIIRNVYGKGYCLLS